MAAAILAEFGLSCRATASLSGNLTFVRIAQGGARAIGEASQQPKRA
jgi:hypothetical protein